MFTAEVTVEYVSLLPKQAKAYWAALDYFAERIKSYMQEERAGSYPALPDGAGEDPTLSGEGTDFTGLYGRP